MLIDLFRRLRSVFVGLMRGLAELFSFALAVTTAVAQFLMGRWPDPVMLGGKRRRASSPPTKAGR